MLNNENPSPIINEMAQQRPGSGYTKTDGTNGYTPTAGEQKMLGQFDNRMANLDAISATANPAPDYSKMTRLEAAQYTNDPAVLNAAMDRDQGQGLIDSVRQNSNLSGRQKIAAMGQVGDALGTVPDYGQVPGLSARQATNFDVKQFGQGVLTQEKNAGLFARQSKRAFQNGGKPETAEQLLARMNATYGKAPSAETATPAPQAQVQAPAPQPKPAGSLIQQAAGIFSNRAKQIDKAAGYNQGGKIQGPGTATSDSIAAQTQSGEDIRVANGERIVSVAQDQVLERIAEMLGYDSVDSMFEAMTGKPVGPTIKGGKLAAASGMPPEDQYGQATATSSLAPMNGQATRAGAYPSKLEQAFGAPVVPAASNIHRGDVGPSVIQQQLSANVARMRGPEQPAPYSNEGRSVPHPVSVPASRPGAAIQAVQPVDNTPPMPLTTKDVVQGGYLDRGNGILAQRGKAGSLNVTNVDTGNLTDPTKRAIDDSASALIDQKGSSYNPAAQLERMQRLRLTSDATDPTITDPNVRAQAVQGLNILNAGRQVDTQANTQAAQAKLHNVQALTAEQTLGLHKEYLDPATKPERRTELHGIIRALSGKERDPANLQAIDVEEPIDPKQPLLGNKKIPYVFDPRSGQSRPMLQPGADPIAQAKAAIARGADPKAVNARLKAMGHPEIK